MTVTKRILLKALEGVDMDDPIFMDNGTDSVEFRGVVVLDSHVLHEDVSTQADGSFLPDNVVVLFPA